MKQYFMTCREASSRKMLRLLDGRQHFVDNSYMFSLQDLVDVQNEVLIKFLEKVYATFVKHIKDECTVSIWFYKLSIDTKVEQEFGSGLMYTLYFTDMPRKRFYLRNLWKRSYHLPFWQCHPPVSNLLCCISQYLLRQTWDLPQVPSS